MSTSTLTRPSNNKTGNGDIQHATCCDIYKSLCGIELKGIYLGKWVEVTNPCVVCEMLTECPLCGFRFPS